MQSSAMTNVTGAEQHPVNGADRLPYAWLVIGLFLLALLLRLACFTGLVATDDLTYSKFAQQIASGQYLLEYHHYAIRFGVIMPVGLAYVLFGINEWSTIIVPLLLSSASVVLLAAIASRMFGFRAGLIAGLLLATFPLQLYHASILVPEPIVEFYVLLALFVHVWTKDRPTMTMSALAGALIGFAYLTKEPALFVAPALFIDAALRRQWRHAFAIAAGFCGVVAVEHIYYLAMTGDLLFRPHAMAMHNQYAMGGRSEVVMGDYLLHRLFKEYPRIMLVPGKEFGIHSLVALILSAVAMWRFRHDRRAHFLLIWAAVPWLYLNFGTSSFTHYIPIPVSPRYIDFTYPPLFLLSAWLFADLSSKADWTRQIVFPVMAAVMVVGTICGLSMRATGYKANYVAVLRVISDKVVQRKISNVCFDVAPDAGVKSRWPRAMFILSGGYVPVCEGAIGRVIIRADEFGFPYVASYQP